MARGRIRFRADRAIAARQEEFVRVQPTPIRAAAFAALLAAPALLLGAAPSLAAGSPSSAIHVEHPWARASGGRTAAAYLTVTNAGAAADRLVAASAPVAAKATLHESKMVNGIMEMRPLGPVTLQPGQSLTLKPGGDHIMLTHLKAPLKAGQSFPLTLTFEKAGAITVTVPVEKAGAMHAPAGHGQAMPGMKMD
jgi:copper(I)-binding protein